ncbi:MAG: Trk family potassium uptake protein [Lachnospiraceae bacterium]|jgi:trk system potassium uptake protein TrkH|nr:Trk family potassium uptake protein [Lachnospiraceae bacterium]
MEKNKNIFKLRNAQILILGMLILILIGAFLLKLPISTNRGISLIDSIFVSTSALCVTGLTPIVPVEEFTMFGQVIIMLLIQIGSVGLIFFITLTLLLLGKRIGLSERILIQDSLGHSNFSGIIKLVKAIFKYTVLIELIGAIILSFRLIPMYGPDLGMFYSIFHAISSFCNAGFDLFGNTSMQEFKLDKLMNITTMVLITLGGLGFPVLSDIFIKIKEGISKRLSIKKVAKNFALHTKLVLAISVILVIMSTATFYIFENNNEKSLKNHTFTEKLLLSSFQGVTLRTAGFQSVEFAELEPVTQVTSMIYMFIGGSPISTAGGIKTVTFGIIILLVLSYIRGKEQVLCFSQAIPKIVARRAIVVTFLNMFMVVLGVILLMASQNITFIASMFEVISALGTVGLTLATTPLISTFGKCVLIILMTVGRLGAITISIALIDAHKTKITYPEGNIMMG